MPASSLFDIQINGFAGVDFQQPDLPLPLMRKAVQSLAAAETRRFFLTLITGSIESLCAKLTHFESLRAQDEEVFHPVCGYHLEGPWIFPGPGFRGAHDATCMRAPDLKTFDQLQKAARGHIKLVTLAPEWPGSARFIRGLTDQGVQVSLGHTNADDAEIDAAILAGARFCTHLGNGVPAQLHRHDNVVQRLLARDELTAFFIPDGIHLPPAVLQNFFRAKPAGKAFFTTDAMAAAGAPPGRYQLAGHELEVGPDRVVRLPGSPQFAGSALTPTEGLSNVIQWLKLEPSSARSLWSTDFAQRFNISLPNL